MARKLKRTVVLGGVIYPAGTPATKELEAKVTAGDVWSGDADSDASEGYDAQTVDELEAEASRRGIEVTGTGKDGNVLKKDLVAALEADDKA